MQLKNVELLSPAGDIKSAISAINAGCDAIYLAGTRYGARAYASNFSPDEARNLIRYAKPLGVKVYLTLNTLIKQNEIDDMLALLDDFAKAGIDAVIVQDIGVCKLIKEHYPALHIHASTQMCITGEYSARMLKSLGFSRIIPARETPLSVIRQMKESGIEVECFVHGAMCYSYSGRCLFSSMLGERSANRGRCAGPCRLPYSTDECKDKYLLSLADLCAIEHIGDLIEAGVDSFKIEGRMKPPLYVATITNIYRKYIDAYPDKLSLSKIDRNLLEHIYHRGEICAEYLNGDNCHHPTTTNSPAYAATSEELIEYANDTFLSLQRKALIDVNLRIEVGKPIEICVRSGEKEVCVQGMICEEAKNSPLTEDNIKSKINKIGDTPFKINEMNIDIVGNAFAPVSKINDIRRQAMEALLDSYYE